MRDSKKLNYLIIIVAIYLTLKLLIFAVGDKMLVINSYHIAIGSLFIPFWFFVGDIITELYGFKFTRKIIFVALICQFSFAFICFITTLMPSNNSETNNAYNLIFSLMPRLAFSSLLALVFGALSNAYLMDILKRIVHGKYFMLRSLGTSLIGEVIFSFIAIYSQFMGKTSFEHILQMLGASVSIKLIVSLIIAYPVSIIANYIRYKAEFDVVESKLPNPKTLIN